MDVGPVKGGARPGTAGLLYGGGQSVKGVRGVGPGVTHTGTGKLNQWLPFLSQLTAPTKARGLVLFCAGYI